MKKNGEIKVCLVGSSGGHLTHLYMLKPFWKDKNRFWVTFDKEDARSLLEGEKVYDVIIQTGFSTYEPKYCQWSKLIPYQQMVKNVADARIVITHGGARDIIGSTKKTYDN